MNLLEASGSAVSPLTCSPVPRTSAPMCVNSRVAMTAFPEWPASTQTLDEVPLGGGRRVAWCRPAELLVRGPAPLLSWARRLIRQARVQLLVAEGLGARELAIAVREMGLPLGQSIVCRDEAIARNVLCDCLGPGDFVLALGVDADNVRRLAERVDWRLEPSLATSA